MAQYTIRPLLKLHKDPARDYVKLGDLTQLMARIKNVQQQQINQGVSVSAATQEYLKILTELAKNLTPKQKLPKSALAARVDDYIRQNKLHYVAVQHAALHPNTFHYPSEPYNYYDIALYNANSNPQRSGHHKQDGLSAVCYARFEQRAEQVLIGNLQIDDRDPERYPWQDAHHEQIMRQRKNLYLNLVQESILTALAHGQTEIMFHRGTAALMAQDQGPKDMCQNVVMTPENYAYYQNLYQTMVKRFQDCRVGDTTLFAGQHHTSGIIIEKTADYYRAHHGCLDDGETFYDLVNARIWGTGQAIDKKLERPMTQITAGLINRDPSLILRSIEELFQAMEARPRAANHAQKLKYLTGLVKRVPAPGLDCPVRLRNVVDKFLIKFNYHEKFLAQNPEIVMVRLTPAASKTHGGSPVRFYNSTDKTKLETFHVKQLLAPKKDKTYIITQGNLTAPLRQLSPHQAGNEGIFGFHEKTLPELFAQLGLGYETVPISAHAETGDETAQAWLITTGLEELQATPRPSFASGPELKVDCETLPRLQAAAQKFGLSPAQLEITNDWLCEAAENYLGKYDPGTDAVTLSTASLSLVAHEGFHRLVACGLVPPPGI